MYERLTDRNEVKAFCSPKNSGLTCIGVGNCHECELRRKINEKLAAYEDTGLTPDEVQELAQAKAEGRLFIIPEGYESAKEFFHVVEAPIWCIESGSRCEACLYRAEDDCKFKPYVSRISPNTVFEAMYILRGLSLSKEAAEQALSTCNTTGESEHRRGE